MLDKHVGRQGLGLDNVNEKRLHYAKMEGDQAENGVNKVSIPDGLKDKWTCPFRLGLKFLLTVQEESHIVTKSTYKYFLNPF